MFTLVVNVYLIYLSRKLFIMLSLLCYVVLGPLLSFLDPCTSVI